jgi:xanthine dehydrogenase accessory factor
MKQERQPIRVLVRGSNDIGSAVVVHLFRAGYRVAIHDLPQPTATRRKMAFTDAIFDRSVLFEGLQGVRVDDLDQLEGFLASPHTIPISVSDFTRLLDVFQPDVLVDARMRKHQQPETQRGLAALTMGLGPNFIAGETVDLAIETGWGDSLGQVIQHGSTNPLQGEPRSLGGHARERYVYTPHAGTFHTHFNIGDPVQQGQVVAWVDSTPLHAPLSGRLRGLTRHDVPVQPRTKVIEVDPRGDSAQFTGIAERPARIAKGVLKAVLSWANTRDNPSTLTPQPPDRLPG